MAARSRRADEPRKAADETIAIDDAVTGEARIKVRAEAHEGLTLVVPLKNAGLLSNFRGVLPGDPRAADDAAVIIQYYDGRTEAAAWRRASDRVLLCRANEGATASSIVRELAQLVPEGGTAQLEPGPAGRSLLRVGKHAAPLPSDGETDRTSVAIGTLVAAFNGLLGSTKVRERFVPLISEANLELYAALPVGVAMEICKLGLLSGFDVEELMAFAGW